MATNSTTVELAGVRKEFGDTTAVDGIDLELENGEFFSLLGPSGCGKTTTLRMISGFETPTAGKVKIEGENVVNRPPNERNTNLVFQSLSLFPHMSVYDNVGYGLKKSNVDERERDERIRDYLDIVGLSGYADRNPTELSGGQQQRVAIARALVNEPDILLLDEPLSSLDRKLRQRMQVELRQIHQRVEGTFFYVTHDQDVAMTMSDRLAVMNDGQIEQVGTPQEIYRDPASKFVADFIGDTNLITGTVENGDDSVFRPDGSTPLSVSLAERAAEGTATVSIRPEEIRLQEPGSGLIDGEVVDRHFHGDRTNYVIEPNDDSLPRIEATVQGRPSLPADGRVSADFDGGAVTVFSQ